MKISRRFFRLALSYSSYLFKCLNLTGLTGNMTIFIICHPYKYHYMVFSLRRGKTRLTQALLSVCRPQRWEPLLWKMNSVCFKSSLLSDSTQNQLKMFFLYKTTVGWYTVYDWLRLSKVFSTVNHAYNGNILWGGFIMVYTCMFFIILLLTCRVELKVLVRGVWAQTLEDFQNTRCVAV